MGCFVDALVRRQPAADGFTLVMGFQLGAAAVEHQRKPPAADAEGTVWGHGRSPLACLHAMHLGFAIEREFS